MTVLSLIPVFVVLALLAPAIWALTRVYLLNRTERQVTCPRDAQSATIRLDVGHAVLMHTLGETTRRVKACSRWPEHRNCNQLCMK